MSGHLCPTCGQPTHHTPVSEAAWRSIEQRAGSAGIAVSRDFTPAGEPRFTAIWGLVEREYSDLDLLAAFIAGASAVVQAERG